MISSPQFKTMVSVHGHHYCVPKGLKNLGNSCYMNAVMQALAVSDSLYQSVRSSNHSSHCQLSDCVLCSLERCISDLRRPIPLTRNFHPMMRLVRLLPRLSLEGAVMTSGRQEDAHEFLSHLIMAAVEDGNASNSTHKESDSPDDEQCKPLPHDADYLHALFDGSLCSSVRCRQCGTVSQTVEAMQGLELEVAHAGTLQAALEGFCRTEELDKNTDNAYDCSVCKEHTAAQKTLKIQKSPKLLRIQMKRFVFTEAGTRISGSQKLSHLVEFPEQLDLTSYMLDLTSNSEDQNGQKDETLTSTETLPPVYRLSAVVVHLGQGLHSGHYTAYVHPRSTTGQHTACPWYFVSDDTVRRVPLQEVLSQSAYMLFYEQVVPDESNLVVTPVETTNRQFTSPKRVEKRALSAQNMTSGGSLSDRLNRQHQLPPLSPTHQENSNASANGERSTAYQRHYEQQAESTTKDSRFGSNPLFSTATTARPVGNKAPTVQYHVEVQQRAARTFSVNNTSPGDSTQRDEGTGGSASATAGTSTTDSNKRPRHSYFAFPSFTLSKKRLLNSVNIFSSSKRRRDVGELGHHHLATPASAKNTTNSTTQCASDPRLSTFFAQQQYEATPHKDSSLKNGESGDKELSIEDTKRRRVTNTTSTSPTATVDTGPTPGTPEIAPRSATVCMEGVQSPAPYRNTSSTATHASHAARPQHISVDVLRENRKKAGGSWLSFLPNKIKTLFA